MSEPRPRERLRPLELIAIALGCGLFVGAVVLLVSRQLVLAGEFALVALIVALVGLAMLDLAISPRAGDGSGSGEAEGPGGPETPGGTGGH